MKKNVMMRVAALLLVCVLATTCGISGTFAKYVTEGTGTDTARVAKWGVEISANFGNLFTQTYATGETWRGDDNVSVNATVDVVAPGTSGTLADFNVTGTPEVDVEVTYEVSLSLNNWEVDGVYYCPIIITVNEQDINGLDYTNAGDFVQAVKDAIAGATAKYNAGTNLADAGTVANDLAVSWRWNFVHTEADAGQMQYQSDYKDTELGDAANATIELEIKCVVTQID